MTVQDQIDAYVDAQPEPKRSDMRALDAAIRRLMPGCELWFLDGKDDSGKTVSNPSIGYGRYTMQQAGGRTREFYQIGLSANTSGLSVYVMGIADRTYLARTYGEALGKANVSGYCLKFRALKDIRTEVLEAAMRDGLKATSAAPALS